MQQTSLTLFVLLLIASSSSVLGQLFDPYRGYYRPSYEPYYPYPSYGAGHYDPYRGYQDNADRVPTYNNNQYDSTPDIIIEPKEIVQSNWGQGTQIHALCSTAAVERFEISWIRRKPNNGIEQLSSTHELYLRNLRQEDLAYPIFCRLRRMDDGAIFEQQLPVTSPRPAAAAQPLSNINGLKLTIQPLREENFQSGQIARKCYFIDVPQSIANQFEFRWVDPSGRVIENSAILHLTLNDPGDLEGYACEAKHRASGSVYKARYRVSRQATWPNSGTTSSTTDMSRTNNVQYVVNILPTTPEVVIGQQYSMTCEVTPNPTQPVSYTWHYKDRVFQTGPQLTIDAVDFEEVGKYTCQAQWMSGEGYSAGGGMESNATVELNLALTQSQEIDLSSTSTSVMVAMEGVFKELHCEYDHANPGRVQWFFRGEVLEASPTLNVTGRVYRIDRQLVSIIAIKQTEMRHQGLYECLVDGVTKRAQLIIRSDAGLHVNPPEQTVNVGEPAEIHCRIERANEINRELEWFFRPFDGSYTEPINFALPDGFRREDNPVTTQTSFIAIQRARKSDEGEYVCRHPPSGKENVGLLYVLDKGRPQTHRVYITPQIVRVRVEQSISIECYVTDESGQTINYLPTYRVRDNRVVYHTEPIGPNRVRLDISRGLTREFNGTQIECYSEATGVTTTTIIIIEDMCPPDYRRCLSGQCLMSGRFCDGVRDCDDGSDEDSRLCAACDPISKRCGEYGGRQPSKNTYMIHWTCDGEDDCGNGFDESSCSAYAGSKCSESMFRCPNEQRQIPWSFVCDKENDCSGGDDERNCGPPVIQTPQESNHRVRQGSTISMTCRVTGNPIPFVIWRFNWNCLPDEGGRFRINNVAEACGSSLPTVVSTLTITNVQPGDDGIYNCEGLSGLNRALSVDYRLMLEY